MSRTWKNRPEGLLRPRVDEVERRDQWARLPLVGKEEIARIRVSTSGTGAPLGEGHMRKVTDAELRAMLRGSMALRLEATDDLERAHKAWKRGFPNQAQTFIAFAQEAKDNAEVLDRLRDDSWPDA